ncbi:MAG: MerR family transcriptional regulator, partial [Pseudobdellovibrionaceae bacterium]
MINPSEAQMVLDIQSGVEDISTAATVSEQSFVDASGTEPLSLPAALCDSQLLQEIQNIPDKMGFKIG